MIADFHNHLIPGVDDGAQDLEQSRRGLDAFLAAGVGSVTATPHVDGSLTLEPARLGARLEQIDAAWARLLELGSTAFPALTLSRGAECMMDVPEPDFSDARLRLAGGSFVLVEFPFMMVPPESARALAAIRAQGFTPVLAHPERYDGLPADLALVQRWKDAGALLQVNAGSLTGRYGSTARATVLELLRRGWADYLCSDYHARGEVGTAAARRLLTEAGAEEQADLLTGANPGRLLQGLPPIPVPPVLSRRSFASRVKALFGR